MTASLFSPFISQHARLIDIATALPDAALVVERFVGTEAISDNFHFTIDCLSTHAYFDLNALIGEEITLRLLLADGHRRTWHGYVTQALQLGGDGGLARYRLIAEPWLALLERRTDCVIFQDLDVRGVLETVFADYREADWSLQISQPLRTHSRLTQYRETDLAFVRRILAAEGLSYRFEHDQHAQAGDSASRARHKLIVFDRHADLPECPQARFRYHRTDATEAADTIEQFDETHQALANQVSLAGWDYKRLAAAGAEAISTLDNGTLPSMQIYDGTAAYPFDNTQAATRHTDLQLSALESRYRRFAGRGSGRQLAAGHRFTLTQHAQYIADEANFHVLSIRHHGANNLGASMARLLNATEIEAGSYRNEFTAQPARSPVVPQPLPKPVTAAQSAHVVGQQGAPLTTDREHRIKIQFHWQRGETPNPGGLVLGSAASPDSGHNEREAPSTARRAAPNAGAAPSGGSERSERGGHINAPGDERSGTWVRIAEWLAGPNWGSHFLPRIGTEVLVDFIGGDIDRPVVVGQLFTGEDLPPFSAGIDSTANHPGVISGWTSHNHAAGYNQWLVDDAPGQLRTRLASSGADSQLGLGHLIHHHPLSATRGPWRGNGFELRTDGWLAVRAGEGMLLSATARSNATSTQLDVADTVGQLRAAERTAKALSDAAAAQGAQPLAANARQTRFIDGIDPAKDGKFTGSVGGQTAQKAQPATRRPGEPTERFAEPIILTETPDDIGLTSPASTLIFAAEHLHATVQHDWHSAAAHTLSTTVGEAASWFSHAGGIKTIAGAGRHTVQAHTDAMAVHVDKAVTVTSTSDEIRILAKDQIQLKAGQSAVTLSGGNITFACPGKFSVKGAGNAFEGPGRGAASLTALPNGSVEVPHWIGLDYRDPVLDTGIDGAKYEIHFEDGQVLAGALDATGRAEHQNVDRKPVKKVIYKPRAPKEDDPHASLSKLLG
ncbi:type VI secretion system Vgr family protein [Denitromonas sp.]|uniref:type VI secretion system Vgr family protein n=1 Tax=Denitromonas sp. TaxID=2734609 RepID=UPI003A8A95F0